MRVCLAIIKSDEANYRKSVLDLHRVHLVSPDDITTQVKKIMDADTPIEDVRLNINSLSMRVCFNYALAYAIESDHD